MKKNLSICLVSLLLLSNAVAIFASGYDAENATHYKMLVVSADNADIVSDKLTENKTSLERSITVAALNEKNTEEIAAYDIILVDTNSIADLDAEVVKDIVYNGAVLCVQTESVNEALSELYELIGIEQKIEIATSGVTEIGAFISERNGQIVPGVITEGTLRLADGTKLTDSCIESLAAHDIPKDEEARDALYDKIDINNFLDHVFEAREQTPSSAGSPSSLRTAPNNFDREYDDYTTFGSIGNQVVGTMYITQYVYDICTYMSGSTKYAISDVVSRIAVDAGELSYVKTYDTRMHANISNMSIIDETYINRESSNSLSLSGGFSANSSDVITGSVHAGTSYTYSTNNQTITNDFASSKIRNWNSDPAKNWYNASWTLEPGIRVKNSNANTYKSGAFTSVREAAFFWSYMGAQTGTVFTDPFEVGGYWNT